MDPTDKTLDETLMIKAKDMFFRFMPITQIARELGMNANDIKVRAYGNGSNEEMTWRYERLVMSQTEYAELADRNRHLINDSAARILSMVQKSITVREKKKDASGEFVPLNHTELDSYSMTILKLDRLVPVERFVAMDIHPAVTPMKDVGPSAPEHEGALNMGRVIEALRKDKTMLKRLGLPQGDDNGADQQSDERNGTSDAVELSPSGSGELQEISGEERIRKDDRNSEEVRTEDRQLGVRVSGSQGETAEVEPEVEQARRTPSQARPEHDEGNSEGILRQSLGQQKDRRESKIRAAAESGSPGVQKRIRRTEPGNAAPVDRFDSDGILIRATPQSIDQHSMAAQRPEKIDRSSEGSDLESGQSGAGESQPENEWDVGEAGIVDAISDEYS